VLAAVPLGGYVKMLDEREGPVPESQANRAFNRKSVFARIAIVLAGPVANFLLAILIYWVLFVVGLPGMKAVVGDPPANTAAAMAGFTNGEVVTAVGEDPVTTWGDVRWILLKEAVKRGTVTVEVESPRGARTVHRLDLSGISKDDLDKDFFAKLGLRPFRPRTPAELGRIVPGSAAERAGLHAGDQVLGVSGKPVATWFEFTAEVASRPGRAITLEIERGAQRFTVNATPDVVGEGDNRIGRLGVEGPESLKREYERMSTTVRYGPVDALGKAIAKVYDLSTFALKMLGRMIVGDVSWKNLSGPITIADYAGQSAQLGWVTWLGFLALVSVSLGVLNLLPIPLLDGGHLVYYFAEIVKGTPVSERTMEIGQRFGLALLLGLTFFAFYNDLNRLFTG
jgi:regulator of sigma E protease